MHATKQPPVITQDGTPDAEVLMPAESEGMGYLQYVKAKVQAGCDSAQPGKDIPSGEVRRLLKALLTR